MDHPEDKPVVIAEESRSRILFRNAVAFTFILIIVLLVTHMLRDKLMQHNQTIAWGEYILLLGAIIVTQLQIRDGLYDGKLSFGQGLTSGIIFSIMVALMFSVFTLIFYLFIGPEVLGEMKVIAENTMRENGTAEDQIKTSMQFTNRIFTPVGMSILVILGYSFVGTIMSLIASLFTQRSN